jgi:hypothetical protein
MFAIPAVLGLVFCLAARPMELFPRLAAVPILYVLVFLGVVGIILDMRLSHTKPRPAPQLVPALLFVGWGLVTVAVQARTELPVILRAAPIPFALYFLVAHAVQSFRALQWVAATVLGCVIILAGMGVYQGLSPLGCVYLDPVKDMRNGSEGHPDGRPCEDQHSCEHGDFEPGGNYICEHIGAFELTSVKGRVRYVGTLQDPNEFALFLGTGLAFAFAFARRGGLLWTLVLVGTLLVVFTCVIMTESRGGQYVCIAVVGCYAVRRFGLRGLAVGALLSLPLLVLGGRQSAEAASSTLERLDCWHTAVTLFLGNPLLGVGQGQFTEHHTLTAHNSYLLAAAELGFPGLVLWSVVLYLSLKPVVLVLRRYADVPEAKVARTWAMALLAAWCGLLVGIFFLSFSYHTVLWLYIGLCGAFYQAVRRHDADFHVRFRLRDLGLLVGVDAALLVGLYVFTRAKVG